MKEYLENRIAYLIKLEREELEEIDHLERGVKREVKWKFIHEIGARKNELQDALKFLETAQLQQHIVMQAEGSDGAKGAAVGQRSVDTGVSVDEIYCECGRKRHLVYYCNVCDNDE